MQICADRKVIYDGPTGLALQLNFKCDSAPTRRLETSIHSPQSSDDDVKDILWNLSEAEVHIESVDLDMIYFDKAHVLNDMSDAYIVITKDAEPLIYTNIYNQDVFNRIFIPVLNAVMEEFGMSVASSVNTIDTSENNNPSTITEWVNQWADIQQECPAVPEALKEEAPELYEVLQKVSAINHELIKTKAEIDKLTSADFFMDGMLAITCSSKKEYEEMRSYFQKHDFIVSKSANANEWADLCRYVYCTSFLQGQYEYFVVKAHFQPPRTIDKVMSFENFKTEQETLDMLVEKCNDLIDGTKNLAETLQKSLNM